MARFSVVFLMLLTLAGCSGNYRFSDSEYRPLGDPQTLNRGL